MQWWNWSWEWFTVRYTRTVYRVRKALLLNKLTWIKTTKLYVPNGIRGRNLSAVLFPTDDTDFNLPKVTAFDNATLKFCLVSFFLERESWNREAQGRPEGFTSPGLASRARDLCGCTAPGPRLASRSTVAILKFLITAAQGHLILPWAPQIL